jgi:hypothetical protein
LKTLRAPVQTVQVGRLPLGARLAAGIAALLVVLSILQPWGGTPPPGQRGNHALAQALIGGDAPVSASPPPTATLKPTPGPDQIACPPSGWQFVSLDRLGNWTVRTWDPASPTLTSEPLDPAIEEIPIGASVVLALGGCAPSSAPADEAPEGVRTTIVGVWRRTADGMQPIAVEAFGPVPADPGIARLYRPAPVPQLSAAGSTAAMPSGSLRAWPAGHFVAELALPGEPGGPSGELSAPGTARLGWFIGFYVPGPP